MHTLDGCRVVCAIGGERGAEWSVQLVERGVQSGLQAWQREVCTLWMGAEWAVRSTEREAHTLDECRVVCEVGREKHAHSRWVQCGLQAWQRVVCTLSMGVEWSVRCAERETHTLDRCRVVCKLGGERYSHSRWVQSGLCNWQREGCRVVCKIDGERYPHSAWVQSGKTSMHTLCP
jgi:hypothetical protein